MRMAKFCPHMKVRTILIVNDHRLLRRTAHLFFLSFFAHFLNPSLLLTSWKFPGLPRPAQDDVTNFYHLAHNLYIYPQLVLFKWNTEYHLSQKNAENVKTQFSSSFLQTTCKILSIKLLIEYRVSVRQVPPKLLVHSTL